MYKSRYQKKSSGKAKKQNLKKYAGGLLILGFFAGVIALLRADFLQTKDFQVLGADQEIQETIKTAALNFATGTKFLVVPKSNIFLLDKEDLAAALLSQFTRLESVEINKQFFAKKVELTVTERQAEFWWCDKNQNCFLMSKDGFIFEQILATSSASVDHKIIFRGVLENDPLLKSFATAEQMQNYRGFIETLQTGNFEVSSMNIEFPDKGVAETNIGNIIFNPEDTDLVAAAKNAIILINEIQTKNPAARFNYIDARFGNKVFYKLTP